MTGAEKRAWPISKSRSILDLWPISVSFLKRDGFKGERNFLRLNQRNFQCLKGKDRRTGWQASEKVGEQVLWAGAKFSEIRSQVLSEKFSLLDDWHYVKWRRFTREIFWEKIPGPSLDYIMSSLLEKFSLNDSLRDSEKISVWLRSSGAEFSVWGRTSGAVFAQFGFGFWKGREIFSDILYQTWVIMLNGDAQKGPRRIT